MKGNRLVLVAAVVAGLLTYGALVGGEAVLTGGPEATADEAVVQGTTTHLDRTGRPTAVGEVENRYGEPITNVTVTVRFFRNGEQVGERTGRTLRTTIPAGASAPFDLHMAGDGGERVDRVETSLSYDRGGDAVDGLTVSDERVRRTTQHRVEVAATVTNTADRPLVLSAAVGTFYDEARAVLGARRARPDRYLAPGESVTVRLQLDTLGDVPSRAAAFADFDVTVVVEQPD